MLADAGNATKMRQVFEKYRPGVVFHAAAYKHVPLMEANPLEAVRNNTLVTRTVADIAVEFGAKRFVLVSTDKAVNAKTVMGSRRRSASGSSRRGAIARTRRRGSAACASGTSSARPGA